MATVGSTSQVSETVTHSRAEEHSWGIKVSVGVDAKINWFVTESALKTSLETSYNGKISTSSGAAFGNTFTVSGSATVDLPPNRM